MSNKGLDSLFIHYGIRKDDMATIEAICEKYEVEAEWLKEYFLIKNEDLDEKALKKLMEKALQKIK